MLDLARLAKLVVSAPRAAQDLSDADAKMAKRHLGQERAQVAARAGKRAHVSCYGVVGRVVRQRCRRDFEGRPAEAKNSAAEARRGTS